MGLNIKEKIKNNKFLYRITFKVMMWRLNRRKIIRGKNNKIINLVASYKVTYRINGNNNIIEVGDGSKLANLKITIIGNNNRIVIGKYTDIREGSFWLGGDNCLLHIGNNVSIYGTHYAAVENGHSIIVGDNSQTGFNAEIRTSDSHSILDSITGERINYAKNIEIGSHVWIGVGAIILKGVKVGDNSIIGTGAIVTKDVPSNSIAAGNPAKIVKQDINWDHRLLYTENFKSRETEN